MMTRRLQILDGLCASFVVQFQEANSQLLSFEKQSRMPDKHIQDLWIIIIFSKAYELLNFLKVDKSVNYK